MKIRCIKCEQVKELNQEELKEVGTFVESRKLRAVGFLKFLSLDLRQVCKDEREHQWEFEESFDKDVHLVAKNCNDAEKETLDAEKEAAECEIKIAEFTAKKSDAIKNKEIQKQVFEKGKEILKEIAFIPDPKLWS